MGKKVNLSAPFRRQSNRVQFPAKFGWILLVIAALLLIVVFSFRRARDDGFDPIDSQQTVRHERVIEGFNVTEEMLRPQSIFRQVLDQISLARAFLVIAKESGNLPLSWDLGKQIQKSQLLLSEVANRRAPLGVEEADAVIRDMAFLIYQAQAYHYDSATMIMTFKVKIQSLQEQVSSLTAKSTKYGQIAAEEVPKSLYCLGVRLTCEWYENHGLARKINDDQQTSEKLRDNTLNHFCVFSDNIIATSVVVNSTAFNGKDPEKIVFHLVTDEVNYAPMKAWFSMNYFRGVLIDVQKIEDFRWLNASYVPVLKQLQDSETKSYYFSSHVDGGHTPVKYRNPKYLSMLNHLRFYIPEVYPDLHKVVFLDDDVVVQKDLGPLFSIDLKGNVNGAVETCMETFHRFHTYLNFSHPLIQANFDPNACGWAFGMNVFDLVQWRKRNLTQAYHFWQERNVDRTLWKLGTLPPGLLTFYGLTEHLDASWHVLGLGYTDVDARTIADGAVIHFNGNMKPWLKIGMEKYKSLWDKYVDYTHTLLQQCNFQ